MEWIEPKKIEALSDAAHGAHRARDAERRGTKRPTFDATQYQRELDGSVSEMVDFSSVAQAKCRFGWAARGADRLDGDPPFRKLI